MKDIILDERAYAEDLIENYSLGKDEYVSICILAKYWRSEGLYAPQIRRKIEEHILRSKPYARMFQYAEMIANAVEASRKWPLRELDSIEITQQELDQIALVDGMQEQQLLFTMLCLAKYRHAVNANSDGWISTPRVDVYKWQTYPERWNTRQLCNATSMTPERSNGRVGQTAKMLRC